MTISYQLKLSALTFLSVVALISATGAYLQHQRWRAAKAEAVYDLLSEQARLSERLRKLSIQERLLDVDSITGPANSRANTTRATAILDQTGKAIAGSRWLEFKGATPPDPYTPLRLPAGNDGTTGEALVVLQSLGNGQQLLLGSWTDPIRAEVRQFWRPLIVGGIAVAIPLLILAMLGQRNSRRQLEAFSSVCESAGGGDLKVRFPDLMSSSELGAAGRFLNLTFQRLENHVSGLTQLADSIQHEVGHGVSRIDTRMGKLGAMLPQSDKAARLLMEDIKTECEAIAASAKAMLSLSDIKAGESFVPIQTDLAGCTRDVLDTLSILAEERHIDVTTILQPSPVLGDPQLLQIMISNLVSNAIKYTPEHGSIKVTVKQEGDTTALVVADSGPGIPIQDREDVFVPRRRLARDRQSPGHGYGLAIARTVAERHAGSLRIENSDYGARFVVRIPAFAT